MDAHENKCFLDSSKNCPRAGLIQLKNCTKDTFSHLRYLKSTSDIQIPEALLILNRASVQGLRPSFLDNHICCNHRADLGLQWKRKKRTCSHPLHDSTKAGTIAKGINLIQSREIWLKLNLHVPVGSGICRRCIEKHKNEIQIGTDLKEELREMCGLLELSTTDSVTNQCRNYIEDMEMTDPENDTDEGAAKIGEGSMEVMACSDNKGIRFSQKGGASDVPVGKCKELQNTSLSQVTDSGKIW